MALAEGAGQLDVSRVAGARPSSITVNRAQTALPGRSAEGRSNVRRQCIDSGEIVEAVHARRAPMISLSAYLRR